MPGKEPPKPEPLHEVRYERVGVLGDISRGALGALVVITPLVSLDLYWLMQLLCAGLGGLFLWFAIRNVLRLSTVISADENALRIQGWRAAELKWSQLARYEARYFSTRRDRSDGWLQLSLWDTDGKRLTLDSGLMDFDQLGEHVAYQGRKRDLVVDDVTVDNLTAVGVSARFFTSAAPVGGNEPAGATPQHSPP